MPPPLANPQGSRTGLITTLVVFIVLFLIATVLGVSALSKNTKIETDAAATQKKMNDVISPGTLGSPAFDQVMKDRQEIGAAGAFEAVLQQRDELVKLAVGQSAGATDARNRAKAAIDQANKLLDAAQAPAGGTTRPAAQVTSGQSLAAAVTQLAGFVAQLQQERDQLNQQLAAAQAATGQAAAAAEQAMQEKDKQIAAKDQEVAAAKAASDTDRQQLGQQNQSMMNEMTQRMKPMSDDLLTKDQQIASKDQEMKALQSRLNVYDNTLKRFRLDAKDNMTRRPDGKVNSISDNTCFITLGVGDRIVRGMTFEVYDQFRGIPPVTERASGESSAPAPRAAAGPLGVASSKSAAANLDLDLPRGKASIEVISVGPGHVSQCRIVKLEPGQQINQGDLIANLIYDPNIKQNFYVYGNFDFSGRGNVNPQDAERVRRMIQGWGGAVAAEINTDTDFLVLGYEPVVKSFTDEELQNPIEKDRFEKSVQQRQAYDEVRNRAAQRGIPILNQNQFLMLTGYYDQARR